MPSKHDKIRFYASCEILTEVLLYCMIVLSPWFFGSTEERAIRVMNIGGFLLGALLFLKLWLRRKGLPVVRPARITERAQSLWLWSSVILTVLILVWCLIHALNRRASYSVDTGLFTYYKNFIKWLPHTYDSNSSWFYFLTYLSLALSFWAIRDWLLGIHPRDFNKPLPSRLQRLFWMLLINGSLLGLEGIIQRLEGSGKLLFLVKPRWNQDAASQFGPYAYRSNAAQYFNLIWPLLLAFWFLLKNSDAGERSRQKKIGSNPHVLLLPGIILIGSCPFISLSRGGSVIAGLLILAAAFCFLMMDSEKPLRSRFVVIGVLSGILALGNYLSWGLLQPRLKMMMEGDMSTREQIYINSLKMVEEFFWLGSGPGTFHPLYQLYLEGNQHWEGQMHNDWMETLVTFGLVGSVMLILWFLVLLTKRSIPGGIRWPRIPFWLIIAGIFGCLLHALVDFPLQIHSVLFAFMLNCCVLSVISRN